MIEAKPHINELYLDFPNKKLTKKQAKDLFNLEDVGHGWYCNDHMEFEGLPTIREVIIMAHLYGVHYGKRKVQEGIKELLDIRG